MRVVISIVTAIAILIACCVFAYILGRGAVEPEIKIEKVTVTKTQYIQVPSTESELIKCYRSPLRIGAEIEDDVITVTAQDNCKKAEAYIALDVVRPWPQKHDIIIPTAAFFAGLVTMLLL